MNNFTAVFITSIFGLCKKTKAPGTIASFVSLIFSFLSYYFFDRSVYIFLLLIFLIIGFLAIQKVQKKEGNGDHQWIGIDEWIGMWIANLFLFEFQFSLAQAIGFSLLSFAIFRIIDISKFIAPLRIVNEDKNQNALAIILDDFIGGCYTYLLVLIIFGFYDLNFLYASFFLLLTPMIANMTPTLLKMKFWSAPINERIFGKNKTWRGFIGAIIVGTLCYVLLTKLNLMVFGGNLVGIILIGFLFSFGAIGGDLIKSFFKRKMGIPPGESWTPWDQIDYVLGAMILTYPIFHYTSSQIIPLLVLGGTISAVAHRIGYEIKINKSKQ